mmetsp:Transcript_19387/g.74451  ORF Transcript_19387/g.74451 Transcript_19387/m.74451 type:complete len:438 (+) Transcript_19387:201-1514(+)
MSSPGEEEKPVASARTAEGEGREAQELCAGGRSPEAGSVGEACLGTQNDTEEDKKGTADAVSMVEVLAGWQSLEEEASVQGMEEWGDDKRCTFLEGGDSGTTFVQPMFSCYDCMEKAGVPFAFCFGCSMNCHLDHRLEEVFDKRDMRCDCGAGFLATATSRCQLMDKSMTEGYDDKKYGHNFRGRYCWCDRPYNASADEMLQCLVCQDWFHTDCVATYPRNRSTPSEADQHIASDSATAAAVDDSDSATAAEDQPSPGDRNAVAKAIPGEEQYDTFVCATCATKHPLLRRLGAHCMGATVGDTTTNKRHGKVTDIEVADLVPEEVHLFLKEGWKDGLCRCESCTLAFTDDALGFLLLREVKLNSGTAGAAMPADLMDVSMHALEEAVPSVSRRLDLARGLRHFSDTLRSVLSPLAERGETVTPEHIQEFVQQLKGNK